MEGVKGERKGRDLSPLVFALCAYLVVFSLILALSCQWWRSMSDRMNRPPLLLFSAMPGSVRFPFRASPTDTLWPSVEQKSNFAVIGFHLSSRQTDTTELAKLSWNWPAGASAMLLGPSDMQANLPPTSSPSYSNERRRKCCVH